MFTIRPLLITSYMFTIRPLLITSYMFTIRPLLITSYMFTIRPLLITSYMFTIRPLLIASYMFTYCTSNDSDISFSTYQHLALSSAVTNFHIVLSSNFHTPYYDTITNTMFTYLSRTGVSVVEPNCVT